MPVLLSMLPPTLIIAGIIWIIAICLIFIDIYRAFRLRQQHRSVHAWYARPLPWFAACGLPIGALIALIPLMVFPSQFWGILLLVCCVLTLFFLVGGLVAIMRWDMQQVAQKEEIRLRQLATSRQQEVIASRGAINAVPYGFMFMGFMTLGQLIGTLISHFSFVEPLTVFFVVACLIPLGVLSLWGRAMQRFYKLLNRRKIMLTTESWWLWWSRNTRPVFEEPLQAALPPLVLNLGKLIIPAYLALFALMIFCFWFPGQAGDHTGSLIFTIFYTPYLLFWLLLGWQERVETTTQSLAVVRGMLFASSRREIPWQEVRLFVCYKSFSFLKRQTTMTYELSSAARTVQWTRVINTRSPFTVWKPQLPAEEYSKQTQELCAFISRQTGLQLHNLSEERKIEIQQSIAGGEQASGPQTL